MTLPVTFIERSIRLTNAGALHYVEQGAADGTLRDQRAVGAALGGEPCLYAGARRGLQWGEPKRLARDLAQLIERLGAAPTRSTGRHRR